MIPKFYQENKITRLGVYNDRTMKTHRAFRVPGLPTTVLLDRQGRQAGRLIGPAEWTAPEALRLIRYLLDEPKLELPLVKKVQKRK